jgi:peptidoglycan/LPS O-acetylase OafA/YrhL
MLPILAWGLSRLGTRRRVIYALLLLVIFGLVLRSFAAWVHYSDGIEDPADAPGLLGLVSSILFGIRGKFIEIFALGMLASMFYVWAIEERHWTHIQARKLAYALMPVCILGIVYSFLWAVIGVGRFTDTNAFFWPSIERHGASAVAYAIAGDWLLGVWAVLFVVIVLCLPHSWGRVFSLRPLTFAGMISYSLYLWHWPIMRLNQLTGASPHPIVTLSVIFIWSAVLYYVVERPFLRYRHSK